MSQPQQRISQIREILHTLAAAYPRFELTKEREAVYITYLSDIPLEELRAASIAYITNSASGFRVCHNCVPWLVRTGDRPAGFQRQRKRGQKSTGHGMARNID